MAEDTPPLLIEGAKPLESIDSCPPDSVDVKHTDEMTIMQWSSVCKGCDGFGYYTKGTRLTHIYEKHMETMRYYCPAEGCTFARCTRSTVRQHMRVSHDYGEEKLVIEVDLDEKEGERLLNEYFWAKCMDIPEPEDQSRPQRKRSTFFKDLAEKDNAPEEDEPSHSRRRRSNSRPQESRSSHRRRSSSRPPEIQDIPPSNISSPFISKPNLIFPTTKIESGELCVATKITPKATPKARSRSKSTTLSPKFPQTSLEVEFWKNDDFQKKPSFLFNCRICSKRARSAVERKDHCLDFHLMMPGYKCVLCGFESNRENGRRHLNQVHNYEKKDLNPVPMQYNNEKLYTMIVNCFREVDISFSTDRFVKSLNVHSNIGDECKIPESTVQNVYAISNEPQMQQSNAIEPQNHYRNNWNSDLTPQHLTPQNLTPQHLTAQNLTSQHLTPQNLTPQHLIPQNLTPQHLTPQHLLPQDLVPQNMTLEDLVPQDLTLHNLVAQDLTTQNLRNFPLPNALDSNINFPLVPQVPQVNYPMPSTSHELSSCVTVAPNGRCLNNTSEDNVSDTNSEELNVNLNSVTMRSYMPLDNQSMNHFGSYTINEPINQPIAMMPNNCTTSTNYATNSYMQHSQDILPQTLDLRQISQRIESQSHLDEKLNIYGCIPGSSGANNNNTGMLEPIELQTQPAGLPAPVSNNNCHNLPHNMSIATSSQMVLSHEIGQILPHNFKHENTMEVGEMRTERRMQIYPSSIQQNLVETSHVCEECSESFAKAHQLKSHMKKHDPRRPFACGDCRKDYKTNWELNRHRKSISHYKPPIIHDSHKPKEIVNCVKSSLSSSNNSGTESQNECSDRFSDMAKIVEAVSRVPSLIPPPQYFATPSTSVDTTFNSSPSLNSSLTLVNCETNSIMRPAESMSFGEHEITMKPNDALIDSPASLHSNLTPYETTSSLNPSLRPYETINSLNTSLRRDDTTNILNPMNPSLRRDETPSSLHTSLRPYETPTSLKHDETPSSANTTLIPYETPNGLNSTLGVDETLSSLNSSVRPVETPSSNGTEIIAKIEASETAMEYSLTIAKRPIVNETAMECSSSISKRQNIIESVTKSSETTKPMNLTERLPADRAKPSRHNRKPRINPLKQRIYKCLICNEVTLSQWKYHIHRDHMKVHLARCPECDFSSVVVGNVKTHLQYKHKNNESEPIRIAYDEDEFRKWTLKCFGTLKPVPATVLYDSNAIDSGTEEFPGISSDSPGPTNNGLERVRNIDSRRNSESPSLDSSIPSGGYARCLRCDRSILPPNRRAHVENVHMKQHRFKCPDCKFTTHTQLTIRSHFKEFHNDVLMEEIISPVDIDLVKQWEIACFGVESDNYGDLESVLKKSTNEEDEKFTVEQIREIIKTKVNEKIDKDKLGDQLDGAELNKTIDIESSSLLPSVSIFEGINQFFGDMESSETNSSTENVDEHEIRRLEAQMAEIDREIARENERQVLNEMENHEQELVNIYNNQKEIKQKTKWIDKFLPTVNLCNHLSDAKLSMTCDSLPKLHNYAQFTWHNWCFACADGYFSLYNTSVSFLFGCDSVCHLCVGEDVFLVDLVGRTILPVDDLDDSKAIFDKAAGISPSCVLYCNFDKTWGKQMVTSNEVWIVQRLHIPDRRILVISNRLDIEMHKIVVIPNINGVWFVDKYGTILPCKLVDEDGD